MVVSHLLNQTALWECTTRNAETLPWAKRGLGFLENLGRLWLRRDG